MSELMAKALLLIGQGMHGREVTIRSAALISGRWQMDHGDNRIELVQRSSWSAAKAQQLGLFG